MKFIKRYWCAKKKENLTCVSGRFFIILFSFPLSLKIWLTFISSKNIVLNNKGCIDVKILHLSYFIHHSKRNILFQKITLYFLKLLLNKFGWSFKNTQPSRKRIPNNLRNTIGAGEWCKPKNVPLTTLATFHC